MADQLESDYPNYPHGRGSSDELMGARHLNPRSTQRRQRHSATD